MNWDRVEGNWKEFKGKAKQKWGKLTNDDLDVIEGKRKELAGHHFENLVAAHARNVSGPRVFG